MNKYEQALVQTQKWLNSDGINYGASYEHTLLKELVDRATPKLPIYIDSIEENCCPICDWPIQDKAYIFCPHCGQAIDWSDK